MGKSQTITHFIETDWNDGESTRYGWHRRDGKPTLANLRRLVEGKSHEFKVCRLVHADTTVVATIQGL